MCVFVTQLMMLVFCLLTDVVVFVFCLFLDQSLVFVVVVCHLVLPTPPVDG